MQFQQVNCVNGPREIAVLGFSRDKVIYNVRYKEEDKLVKKSNLWMSRAGFESRFGIKL